MKDKIAISGLLLSLALSLSASAETVNGGKQAVSLTIPLDQIEFRLESPELSSGVSAVAVISANENKSVQRGQTLDGGMVVSRDVDVNIRYGTRPLPDNSAKPIRIIFKLDDHTVLDKSHFRIGYRANKNDTFQILPTEVIWNGDQWEAEAVSEKYQGEFALLYNGDNSTPVHNAVDNSARIMINHTLIQGKGDPYIANGTTMVPLRIISESLGAKVDWSSSNQTVNIYNDKLQLKMQIGNQTAVLNGNDVPLNTAPEIIDGHTFVPIRFIAQTFGADVRWYDLTRTVYINQ